MKAFRISWVSFLEDETALDGRSLVYAESEELAYQKFMQEKSNQFNLHPDKIQITSFSQLTDLSS